MKKSIYRILLLPIILFGTSCSVDIVDLDDPQNFNGDNYYNSLNTCQEAVAATYANLIYNGLDKYWFHALDGLAQEMWLYPESLPTVNHFNTYAIDDNDPINEHIWRTLFRHVWRASFAMQQLEKLDPSNYIDQESKLLRDHMIGECKFFRAFAYMHLVQLYGDVPMHMSAEDILDKPVKPLSPVETIESEIIIPEFRDAIAMLPDSWEEHDNTGRITKYAAMVYLAKYYMYQGDWDSAKPLLEEAVAGGFSYAPDFYALFSANDNRTNPEIIMQTIHQANPEHALSWMYYVGDIYYEMMGPNSTNCRINFYSPTVLLDWNLSDGCVQPGAAERFVYDIPNGTSGYLDPRAALSFYGGREIGDGSWLGDRDFAGGEWTCYSEFDPQKPNTGYSLKKYMPHEFAYPISTFGITEINCGYNSTIWTGLCDVKLLLAECRLFGAENDASGCLDLINEVRTRPAIGAEAYRGKFSAEETFELLKRERYLELAFEQHHWFDLLRWSRNGKINLKTQLEEECGRMLSDIPEHLPIPLNELDMNNYID